MNEEWNLGALWLSFQLAGMTSLILLVLGTPLAWWLSQSRHRLRPVIEAITALPLVLPPTVLGFYLLIWFSPNAPLGAWWVQITGDTLAFSFWGLVFASCLYSLPFMVQPLQAAFENVGRAPMEAAALLGARPVDAFFTVATPLALRGYLTGLVLSFAHTVGEFGVVLMVGGNMEGRTRVISIALYERVEMLDYAGAHRVSAMLLVFSFTVLVCVYALNRRSPMRMS